MPTARYVPRMSGAARHGTGGHRRDRSTQTPAPATPSTRSERLHPAHEALLTAQRQVGNAAVVAAGPRSAITVQRGLLDKLRGKSKPTAAPKTHEKQAAHEMTSAEGANEMMRVRALVQGWINERDILVRNGTSVEDANAQVFSKAPPDIQRYLPLHTAWDTNKREVDRARNEEGGTKHGKVSGGLLEHARAHGYRPGVGSPLEAKPKDVEKELKEDQAFARQMQRRAERLLAGEIEMAEVAFETAKETKDPQAVKDARQELDRLRGPGALQNKLLETAMEMQARIKEVTAEKIEAHKASLKVDHLSEAEQWRLREKAKNKVRKDMEGGIDSNLATAGKVVGGIGTVAPKVVKQIGKQAKPLTKTLTTAQKGVVKGAFGTIGQGIKAIGGIFSKAVKLAGTVADRNSDKLDKDANVTIAEQSLGIVKQAASSTRGILKAVQHFSDALGKDPGIAAAIPGMTIAAGVIGFVGNVVTIQPPWERMVNTVSGEAAMAKGGNEVLAGALQRSIFENKLQVTTEVVGMVANGIRVGAAIAEMATAGGMGIPRAIILGSSALEGCKKVSDFVRLDMMKGATQEARKEGALQVKGSGEKLIKTDITYALDTIILAAKKALARKANGNNDPGDDKIIAVLTSYGVTPSEAGRLSLGEIHERMMDKLGQDDDQETLKMKAKAGFEDAKKKLAELAGGDKDKGYKDLDTYAKEQEAEAERKAAMTTGDKVKAKLGKIGGYAKKAVTAPAKITKLGEMAKEKSEKVRRLQEIKNLTNYKDRNDRGRGFRFKEFGADISESVAKLAKWIVATQPPEKAALYLKELNTLDEQKKITKKVGEKAAAEERSKEKVTDRVISPELVKASESMTFSEVRDRLTDQTLSKADREFLRYLLAKKAA